MSHDRHYLEPTDKWFYVILNADGKFWEANGSVWCNDYADATLYSTMKAARAATSSNRRCFAKWDRIVGNYGYDTATVYNRSATESVGGIRCRACGVSLKEANDGKPDCPHTNDCEHDFPGYRMRTVLTPV